MPQPLIDVCPDARVELVPPDALSRRPRLAALVAEVIGIWSAVDVEVTGIVSGCLEADYEVVAAMLNTIGSADAKMRAVDEAAKAALSGQDIALFKLVRKVTKASRDRRNGFAHHVWTTTPQLPDALLLIDPRYLSTLGAARRSTLAQLRAGDVAPDVELPTLDLSKILVFDEADLATEVAEASRAFLLHNQLFHALRYYEMWPFPDVTPREQVLPELFALLKPGG